MLSSSVAQFLANMIDHTVAQVCALFVSSSLPCFMRTLSDLSIYLSFRHLGSSLFALLKEVRTQGVGQAILLLRLDLEASTELKRPEPDVELSETRYPGSDVAAGGYIQRTGAQEQ